MQLIFGTSLSAIDNKLQLFYTVTYIKGKVKIKVSFQSVNSGRGAHLPLEQMGQTKFFCCARLATPPSPPFLADEGKFVDDTDMAMKHLPVTTTKNSDIINNIFTNLPFSLTTGQ